jgi:predicted nucleotidyltransferase
VRQQRTGRRGEPRIQVPQGAIADFCRRHAIRRLALFGSVLGDDFGPGSDVDVLVEFEVGRTPGLAFFAMQDELSALLGREVELHTPNFLSPYFRREVQRTADVCYPQG